MRSESYQHALPVAVFYSYAYEDEDLRKELEKHLSNLQRQGRITTWHSRQITAGMLWVDEIRTHLDTAFVILLLVSPDFLASDRCYDMEMQRALQRYEAQQAHVIPVLLRPVDWKGAPFAQLACLPRNAIPITSWPNRDEAFLDIAEGIRNVIEGQPLDTTLLSLPGNASTTLQKPSFTESFTPQQIIKDAPAFSPKELRFRTTILERISDIWIRGYLQTELEHGTFLALQLQRISTSTPHKREKSAQDIHAAISPFPTGTRLAQVYNQTNGSLLLLGEPGAGKTILLLDLARELLAKAAQDAAQPIPMVISLATWTPRRWFFLWDKKSQLRKWAAKEIHRRYGLPARRSNRWITDGHMILLLDGLDEVPKKEQAGCIKAINEHWNEYGLESPVVVTCRTDDYDTLLKQGHQLQLSETIQIRPLDKQQIRAYLTVEPELTALYEHVIQESKNLHELMTSPLMLSIFVQAYQGMPPEKIAELEGETTSEKELSNHLFKHYIDRMLSRRGDHPTYKRQMIMSRLSWLAQQMRQHERTQFSLEDIGANWLPKGILSRIYRGTVVTIIMAFLAAITIPFTKFFNFISPVLRFPHVPDAPLSISMVANQTMILSAWIVQGAIYLCGGILLLTLLMRIPYILSSQRHILFSKRENHIHKDQKSEELPQESIASHQTSAVEQPIPPSRKRLLGCIVLVGFCLATIFLCTLFQATSYEKNVADDHFQKQCIASKGTVTVEVSSNPDVGTSVDYLCQTFSHITVSTGIDVNAFATGAIDGGEVGTLLNILIGFFVLCAFIPILFYTKTTQWKNDDKHLFTPQRKLAVMLCGVAGVALIVYASAIAGEMAQGIASLLVVLTMWDRSLLVWGASIVVDGIIIFLYAFYWGLAAFLPFLLLLAINRGYVCILLRISGTLPPKEFFAYATNHLLLRKLDMSYMFVHPLLRDYFAGLAEQNTNEDEREKSSILLSKNT